jgi:WD40 repeat protein|eukprot:COSAG03_NODE_5996_length_1135_cov_0.794402_2_plen_109_part_00
MALSIAWFDSTAASLASTAAPPALVSCHADGYVRCWSVAGASGNKSGPLTLTELGPGFCAHNLEAWSIATNPHVTDWSKLPADAANVFTGADDTSLKGWRVGGDGASS